MPIRASTTLAFAARDACREAALSASSDPKCLASFIDIQGTYKVEVLEAGRAEETTFLCLELQLWKLEEVTD